MRQRLIELRRKYNLTQGELGEMCDVTSAAVSQWETGVSIPEIKKLLIIRSRIAFSFDWLITGEGEMIQVLDSAPGFTERRQQSRRDARQCDRRRMDRRSGPHDRRKEITVR